jgi:hypothetical protein
MLTCSGDRPKRLMRPNHAPPDRVQCRSSSSKLRFRGCISNRSRRDGRVYRWQSDAYADLTHFSPDSSDPFTMCLKFLSSNVYKCQF